MPPILLDTNILVYVVDAHDPNRQEKAIALLIALAKKLLGRLSTQSLSEFMSVTINKLSLSPAEMIEQIGNWLCIFPVIDLTPQIVLEAARGVHDHCLSYYDAQIWAAARLHQIPIIFSEDFQDGEVLEGVQIVNPFTAAFNIDKWL
jgi:predicted nucleic acid-binding protein